MVPHADFSGRTTSFATLWEAIARSLFNSLVQNVDFSGRTTIFATPWEAIARSFFQHSGAKLPFAMQSPVRLL